MKCQFEYLRHDRITGWPLYECRVCKLFVEVRGTPISEHLLRLPDCGVVVQRGKSRPEKMLLDVVCDYCTDRPDGCWKAEDYVDDRHRLSAGRWARKHSSCPLGKLGVPFEGVRDLVAGCMAIGPATHGPMPSCWRESLAEMCRWVSVAVVRIDAVLGAEVVASLLTEIPLLCGLVKSVVFVGREKWNLWNWREEMLRALDDVKPEFVLTPDCDEVFAGDVRKDLLRLREEKRWGLMFDFVMADPTEPLYPLYPHMKAFRWRPGLTYRDYRGSARVSQFCAVATHLKATSPIVHHRQTTTRVEGAGR